MAWLDRELEDLQRVLGRNPRCLICSRPMDKRTIYTPKAEVTTVVCVEGCMARTVGRRLKG